MKTIDIAVLNPDAVRDSEVMAVCAARLTQHGHKVTSMADFQALRRKPYTPEMLKNLTKLPHPTLQKFAAINVVVIGASRRFLAQITRHQNEVKFMSASLQYSDYSHAAEFAVPYGILQKGERAIRSYLSSCHAQASRYGLLIEDEIDNDSAGYLMPQGMRNVLIISATPYQWKHMISQRVCRRNTDETRIVMLKIWEQLYLLSPVLFAPDTTGPSCMKHGGCLEGRMSCGKPLENMAPDEILQVDYPLIMEDKTNGIKTD